jgi:molecular chaperone GrpE
MGAEERSATGPAAAGKAPEVDGEVVDGEVVDAEVVEDAPAEAEAEAVEADLDELGRAQRERAEYLELAQRTRADFENYRKRAAREAEEARTRGRADLAERLIPAIDNLERAIEAAGDESDSAAQGSSLHKGVRMVHADLGETLRSAGVEAYDPTGEPFDPEWHEGLATRAEEGTAPGTVIETLAKGYRLDGRLLRPARVVVSE